MFPPSSQNVFKIGITPQPLADDAQRGFEGIVTSEVVAHQLAYMRLRDDFV